MKKRFKNIVLEEINKFLIKEYHGQYRTPFEEFGEGHAIMDEFIDWIQYSSKKGTLPSPSITFEEGIKKGIEYWVKKEGYDYDELYESLDHYGFLSNL